MMTHFGIKQRFKVLLFDVVILGKHARNKMIAYLITDLMETIYEEDGPSTIVLVAGDADYVPPLERTIKKGWRNEGGIHRSGNR